METKALEAMSEAQMLARLEMARFPQELTSPQKKLMAQVAITYGLDPLMGELVLYQGRPFVSIDGRYRKAQDTGRLVGVESRPATREEHVAWRIPEEDYLVRAEVWVKDAPRPFVGWGRVRASETKAPRDESKAGYRPLEVQPQRMAEKRAEAQALRKAFHLPLPSAEEPGEGEAWEPSVTISPSEQPPPAPLAKSARQQVGELWDDPDAPDKPVPAPVNGASIGSATSAQKKEILQLMMDKGVKMDSVRKRYGLPETATLDALTEDQANALLAGLKWMGKGTS